MTAVEAKLRIGVSQCLLGDEVRHDGGHKHDPFITGTLSRFFEWVAVCPEVELGLGVPRESVRLVASEEGSRMVGVRSQKDITEAMKRFSEKRVRALELEGLHGYILKKDSPSCGMERVRVYRDSGTPVRRGRGLFADALMRRFPLLPVEEEGRLHDPAIRENFIERIFAHHRWSQLISARISTGALVQFHSRNKMVLLAHSRIHYEELGRLVAKSGRKLTREALHSYGEKFMECLRIRATPKKHANVLYHLAGFLKDTLTAPDKVEMVGCIEEYRNGLVPLVVPITLLLHHLRRNPVAWAMDQTYLHPYPSELMLRNHV
jgi:uncharacterized protein YbgA (DUF1722 family)/uncharacterized protein YbbK (DUF523 family)